MHFMSLVSLLVISKLQGKLGAYATKSRVRASENDTFTTPVIVERDLSRIFTLRFLLHNLPCRQYVLGAF